MGKYQYDNPAQNTKLASEVSGTFDPIIKTLDNMNSTMQNLGNTFMKQHPTIQKEFSKLGRKFGDVVKASHEFVYKTKGTILANKMTIQNITEIIAEDEPQKEDVMEAVDEIKKLVVKLDNVMSGSKDLTAKFEEFDKEAINLKGNIATAAENLEKQMKAAAELDAKAKIALAEAEKARADANANQGWAGIWNTVKKSAKAVGAQLIATTSKFVATQLCSVADQINKVTHGFIDCKQELLNFAKEMEKKGNEALDSLFGQSDQEKQWASDMKDLKIADNTVSLMKEQAEKAKGALNDLSKSVQQTIMSLKQFLESEEGIKQISETVQGVSPQDRMRSILRKLKVVQGGLVDTQKSITSSLEAFETAVKKCCDVYFNVVYPSFANE